MGQNFNIGNYNDTADEILFKFNIVKYNNKVINCYNIPFFNVHSAQVIQELPAFST